MAALSGLSAWAINFLWATIGRVGVSLGVPAVKKYLRENKPGSATLEDKIYKIYYEAFFLAADSAIKDIYLDGATKDDIARIQSELKKVIGDTNFWMLIEIFSIASGRNLSYFKRKLQNKDSDFILKLSEAVISGYELPLEATGLNPERQIQLMSIIFQRYYDALLLLLDNEQYKLFLDSKLNELEDLLQQDDEGFLISQRLNGQSILNHNLLNQVEKDLNEVIQIQMKDVYVERDMEKYIMESVLVGEEQTFLIKGEAGNGKSSMLWSIYNQMREEAAYLVWLVKAGQVQNSDLLHAASYISTHNPDRKLLILVDTIDNVVGENETFDFFISLMTALVKLNGVQIVMTSRPHEAQIVLNAWDQSIGIRQYALRDFNYKEAEGEEGELFRAIQKYVSNYCKLTTKEVDFTKYFQDVMEAVSNGRSLRSVCVNPLKLRILFSIYSPETIPTEINTFELYSSYWENKVYRDIRGGDQNPTNNKDLSISTYKIAAKMLAHGLPSTTVSQLKSLVDIDNLKALRSRDVVSNFSGKQKDIEFFHQTFFEFAAAKALFHYFQREANGLLEEETIAKKEVVSNYFLLPIYEFLILITSEVYDDSAVEEFIRRLLLSTNNSEVVVGIRIYTLAKTQQPTLQNILQHNIKNRYSSEIVSAFLKIAYNIKDARISHLMQDIQSVWDRSPILNVAGQKLYKAINEKFNTIRLLHEYSKVDATLILDFYKVNGVVDFTLDLGKDDEHDSIFSVIIKTLESFKNMDRPYYLSSLLKLFHNKKEPNLRGNIVKLFEALPLDEMSNLVSEIFTANPTSKQWPKLDLDFHNKIFPGLGSLWAAHWIKNGIYPQHVFRDIDSETFIISKKAKLYGIIPFFDKKDFSFPLIMDWISSLPKNNDLKDYYDILFRTGLKNEKYKSSCLQVLYQLIEEEQTRNTTDTSNWDIRYRKILYSSFESILSYSGLDLSFFLFSGCVEEEHLTVLDNLSAWDESSIKLAARIYSNMLIAKSPPVVDHFESRAGQRPFNKFWHTVSFNLNHRALSDEEISDMLISLVLEHQDLKIVSNVIQKSHEAGNLKEFLVRTITTNKDRLMPLIENNLQSRSGTARRLSFQLYDLILQYTIKNRFAFDDFIEYFEKETDTPSRKKCFAILYKYFEAEQNYRPLILEHYLQNRDAKIIGDTAIYYFLKCLTKENETILRYDKAMIVDFLFKDFKADKNFEKLILVVDLMKVFLKYDSKSCYTFWTLFSRGINNTNLRYGTLKALSHKLRPIFIELIKKSSLEEIKEYIGFTFELEPSIGRTWISSIFSRVGIYEHTKSEFMSLIQRDNCHPGFIAELERQLASKEKTRGHQSSLTIGLKLIDKILAS